MLKARKCVRELAEYDALVNDATITLRLDMNENTTGCSPRVLAKLRNLDAAKLSYYPSRDEGEKLVAESLGIAPAGTLLTNGADEAIDLLCRAYLEPENEVIIIVPTFTMYEIFAQAQGAKVIRVSMAPDFSFPLHQVLEKISTKTRLIVICNPNNPTGIPAERAAILQIIAAAPNAAILVDEAYFHFYGQTLMDQIGHLPNLFIVRTFSKVYGLAGLRLGVLAGDHGQISILKRMAPPFNINAVVLECLAEALRDTQFLENYVAQVRASREWLRQELEQLGFKCWPSETNFLLSRFGAEKKEILGALRHRGIALRDRGDCEGCVRISIGTQPEMERLMTELKQVLSQLPVRQVAQ
jgi:histidinol-phosphate aminotransferase